MKATIVYSSIFLGHRPPHRHPEAPERLRVALSALQRAGLPIEVLEPVRAGVSSLEEIHDPEYIGLIEMLSGIAPTSIDEDTYVSEDTFAVALHAAGASMQAVRVSEETGRPVVALVRPPGHHAGRRGRAMGTPTQGFCIFNNAAVAWTSAREERTCILDFDAHHGNGTQEIFYSNPKVLHIDVHQDPQTLYPGTGFPEDIGSGEARGTKVNIPLPPNSGDDVLREVLEEIVLPIIDQFKPRVLIVSAGFDAYADDGLAHLRLTSSSYYSLGSLVRELPSRAKSIVLEGGYSKGLEKGLPAFVAGLLGLDDPIREKETVSRDPVRSEARTAISRVKRVLRGYWSF
uniref:Histone deacetylase family protein n=1 Tax=Fervidicoccus fontis TaxID=683846 RepID=A0A7J3ZLH2_9CREN